VAEAVRIALLARAGKARDQLHAALNDAGAQIVAEGDPSQMQPADVAAHRPNFFLVSLEPSMEAALERFDDLFSGEDVEVMFDDAEVTATLDGWDLNRWARHLASKVLSTDLMPPIPDGTPEWGAVVEEAVVLEDDAPDDLSDSVSMDADAAQGEGGLDLDLSLDDTDLGLPAASATDAPATPDFGELEFDESVSFSSFNPSEHNGTELDLDVAELAAQLEAFDKRDQRFAEDADLPASDVRQSVDELIAAVGAQGIEEIEAVEALDAPVESVAPAPAAPSFDFSNLELAPMDDAPARAGMAAAARADAGADAEVQAASGMGAVVVLAGLGGPDAVRQLLSSLPETLPVPVLLYQHLEVGKHERLVDQLAKISKLPVHLAREGERPRAGHVSLLPAGLGARASGESLAFAQGALAQLLASVSPEDSMVVVLSGADPQLVPAILAMRDAGGLVLAQDPEVCFDSAAADAMQRQGAAVFPALGLARQVASRWPA
jgi:chemosensory pili system protein ChpB (putative protein-glutamate methylesterase)